MRRWQIIVMASLASFTKTPAVAEAFRALSNDNKSLLDMSLDPVLNSVAKPLGVVLQVVPSKGYKEGNTTLSESGIPRSHYLRASCGASECDFVEVMTQIVKE